MGHEATVSKVSEDQLFYLMSRGLTEEEAMAMIVRLHRADRPRATDGVRPRAQPPDRAADGRGRGLTMAEEQTVAAQVLRPEKGTGPSISVTTEPPPLARRRTPMVRVPNHHDRSRGCTRTACSPSRISRFRPDVRRSGGSPCCAACVGCTMPPHLPLTARCWSRWTQHPAFSSRPWDAMTCASGRWQADRSRVRAAHASFATATRDHGSC